MYFNGCLYYSGLYVARSALSNVVSVNHYIKLSEHPLFSRFLKQIYSRQPLLPQYMEICENNLLLTHYDFLDHNEGLRFKDLTCCLFL